VKDPVSFIAIFFRTHFCLSFICLCFVLHCGNAASLKLLLFFVKSPQLKFCLLIQVIIMCVCANEFSNLDFYWLLLQLFGNTVQPKEIEIAHPVMLKGLYGNYRCIVRRHPSIVSPLFFRRSVLKNVRGEPRTFDLE
jgi:hypothetical protein